jgi:hypothetical protein
MGLPPANELQGIGEYGEDLDVTRLREQWEKQRAYNVAPQSMPIMLHLLLYAALDNSRRAEGMRMALEKIKEIVDAVWPAGTPREIEILRYGRAEIRVPKDLK